MIEDMQLRGLSKRTQESYVRAVQQLAKHYGKSPEQITEEELRQYFLYLQNVKQAAPSSCIVALCAIKFLFQRTLQRHWPTLEFVRPVRPFLLLYLDVVVFMDLVDMHFHSLINGNCNKKLRLSSRYTCI
jgi:glycyl-tRNA synthetase beta subunit